MKQIGVMIGVNVNNQEQIREEMLELKNLSSACEIEIAESLVQKARKIHPTFYLGKGKLEELAELVKLANAEVIVVNQELSPSQIKNIQAITETEVVDRTGLILRIFASRAKTRESKLQVEVVRLQYELPRLIGSHVNLGRQGGGSAAGSQNKGAGETKLELNRRQIEDRISVLQTELEVLKGQRVTQRSKRKKEHLPIVALVGYTNAGKSSLMNYVVQQFIGVEEKLVYEKDMLFATLETSVRNIVLKHHKEFLLLDTVGFVSNLPHNLIKAFRSTLEEVLEADLLIHVVDRSNPEHRMQMQTTVETLQQIGAEHIPVLYAYNKIDLCQTEELAPIEGYPVSAKTGEGMEALLQELSGLVFPKEVRVKVVIPYPCGDVIAKINAEGTIISMTCTDVGIEYELDCGAQLYTVIEKYFSETS